MSSSSLVCKFSAQKCSTFAPHEVISDCNDKSFHWPPSLSGPKLRSVSSRKNSLDVHVNWYFFPLNLKNLISGTSQFLLTAELVAMTFPVAGLDIWPRTPRWMQVFSSPSYVTLVHRVPHVYIRHPENTWRVRAISLAGSKHKELFAVSVGYLKTGNILSLVLLSSRGCSYWALRLFSLLRQIVVMAHAVSFAWSIHVWRWLM